MFQKEIENLRNEIKVSNLCSPFLVFKLLLRNLRKLNNRFVYNYICYKMEL